MEELRVGGKYPPVAGRGEGCFFDLDDAGARLIYCYNRPTAGEIKDFSAGSKFELRFLELGGIIWTTHKCGGQAWNDAPYNPRLSRLTNGLPKRTARTDGLALTMILVDAADDTIKALRLVGLADKFSAALLDAAARLRDMPLDADEYQRVLAEIPRTYSSQRLAEIATHYCRVQGGGNAKGGQMPQRAVLKKANPKSDSFPLRISERERTLWTEAAKRRDLTLSEFMRAAATKYAEAIMRDED